MSLHSRYFTSSRGRPSLYLPGFRSGTYRARPTGCDFSFAATVPPLGFWSRHEVTTPQHALQKIRETLVPTRFMIVADTSVSCGLRRALKLSRWPPARVVICAGEALWQLGGDRRRTLRSAPSTREQHFSHGRAP